MPIVNREKMKAMCVTVWHLVRNQQIDDINDLFDDVDEYDLDTLMALIRGSCCCKKKIPLWSYAIVRAYDLCKEEHSLPRRELYGLI